MNKRLWRKTAVDREIKIRNQANNGNTKCIRIVKTYFMIRGCE